MHKKLKQDTKNMNKIFTTKFLDKVNKKFVLLKEMVDAILRH